MTSTKEHDQRIPACLAAQIQVDAPVCCRLCEKEGHCQKVRVPGGTTVRLYINLLIIEHVSVLELLEASWLLESSQQSNYWSEQR